MASRRESMVVPLNQAILRILWVTNISRIHPHTPKEHYCPISVIIGGDQPHDGFKHCFPRYLGYRLIGVETTNQFSVATPWFSNITSLLPSVGWTLTGRRWLQPPFRRDGFNGSGSHDRRNTSWSLYIDVLMKVTQKAAPQQPSRFRWNSGQFLCAHMCTPLILEHAGRCVSLGWAGDHHQQHPRIIIESFHRQKDGFCALNKQNKAQCTQNTKRNTETLPT